MLPEPALTFTIPSVHDGLPLDCRIYHPASLRAEQRPSEASPSPWRRHAAVLAHPYAPLGGSFDDPVIEVAGARMLDEGYLLATFNFRGAGHSAGKTSWTSKAERADFQSVIAFLAYYVHHLDSFESAADDTRAEDGANDHPSSSTHMVNGGPPTDNPTPTADDGRQPMLIIGGYSYGSLIAAQLPPLETVLEPFAAPPSASHEAQIRLRAASLAAQQSARLSLFAREEALLLLLPRTAHAPRSPSKRGGIRVGGDEGDLSPGRRSADGGGGRRSRSVELEGRLHELAAKTRSSLTAPRRRVASNIGTATTLDRVPEEKRHGHGRISTSATTDGEEPGDQDEGEASPAQGRLPRLAGFATPRQAYVLLSPIPGLASHLVTLRVLPGALSRRSWWWWWSPPRPPEEDGCDDAAEAKLVWHPTLAVRGGADAFVLPYKGREWSARLAGAPRSRFRGVEVPTAGHFWAEEGVLDRLLGLVGEFARGLAAGDGEGDVEGPGQ
ncbi:X-Pro dipeptidyl-peptidase-like domain protein [Cordyceps fumosorosea ARSEF 2679]|uniref:X-Pro dipeptidyl-peptidase-like domain protein n=1 Tax=Cordyceps fumosorosea (strain ARSEF 2679) TaxID=1081104 RepID=A0A162LPB0_CORFA|nr:X-Pro dipeptidyl-peptidase-like domain protein [Cordyceps fumosorosea ARSEF 2679]OAA73674.1 X-Pro dipeptidyl-peptidase-like domain protein [Cordyceps fumosorosea ARSEF 2679]